MKGCVYIYIYYSIDQINQLALNFKNGTFRTDSKIKRGRKEKKINNHGVSFQVAARKKE